MPNVALTKLLDVIFCHEMILESASHPSLLCRDAIGLKAMQNPGTARKPERTLWVA